MDLVSRTTYVLFVNFYTYEYKYLLSEFLQDVCWKEITEEIFCISYFVFMSDLE